MMKGEENSGASAR